LQFAALCWRGHAVAVQEPLKIIGQQVVLLLSLFVNDGLRCHPKARQITFRTCADKLSEHFATGHFFSLNRGILQAATLNPHLSF
jgi:hypothetical protein